MLALHRMTWVILLIACIGTGWFSYQCFLVPQEARFAPEWKDSHWIQAVDGKAPVAYFRHMASLNAIPDAAFITVAASQIFRLYVNGVFIGSNAVDFGQGDFPRAYMYDVVSLLRTGSNVIALRVANVDQQTPSLRVNFGIVRGSSLSYEGSGNDWQATVQSAMVYPRYTANIKGWAARNFDASSWPPARTGIDPAIAPMLTVNPLLYERPMATRWISAGASHEAYFVRQIPLPVGITGVCLRLAATGIAHVFINGHLLMSWNGQPAAPRQNLADYLSDDETQVQYRSGLALGIYNISPYLSPGSNIIAVQVQAPGISAAQVGLDNLGAALSLDILVSDYQGNWNWLTSDTSWHASSQPVEGWSNGSNDALDWPASLAIGRPGASRTFYLPESPTPRNLQFLPFSLVGEVILFSCAGVIGLWLLMSFLFKHYYHRSWRMALETMCLAYLPALACEAMLIVLSREPQIPQPFPYTWWWGMIQLLIVGVSSLLLWLNAHAAQKQHAQSEVSSFMQATAAPGVGLLKLYASGSQKTQADTQKYQSDRWKRILAWLRLHWIVIPLVLLAIPLIVYNLQYEPYWQDELSSYYAAHGVLAHGLPFFPSGFLYEKAELYSYLLALWTLLFGEQGSRFISALEYIVSIPLLYIIGCYFFERRIAFLAAAMLTFSPTSLVWGRQVRMYEQAQLLTLLVMFLFYKALRERPHGRFVYIAMLCLVANYLSHEETFIILPGLFVAVMVATRDARRRLPVVLYRKHWWYAAIAGGAIIAIQLVLTHVTHPPILGTDSSQRPFVQLTTDNIPFYFDILFFPSVLAGGTLPWITINSLLALAGCIWARRESNVRIKYCVLFFAVSFATLVLTFTMQADRYFYSLLPVYYLIGSYALLIILQAIWTFVRSRVILPQAERRTIPVQGGYLSPQIYALVTGAILLLCGCVLIAPILPISNYNLFVSRLMGFSYHRHYPDYDAVGMYMQQHWQKGDIVIAIAPDFSVLYYVGHVDYFISVDRALYLFERNGHIVDTSLGIPALLNQDDLRAVLAAHTRVWIISDNGVYQAQAAKRFQFPPDFHIVFEGYGSAVYFR